MKLNKGSISDGYHTFDELYKHRTALFACLCSCEPDIAWKARKHADGSTYEGFFIAGMSLPNGDVSYHIEDKYWDWFEFAEELDTAPKFDGYSSDDVIDRLLEYFL